MSQRLCPHDGSVLEDKLPPEERLCGQTLAGKYKIEGFLSRGGMGAVYRATHVMLDKPVALKLIRPEIVTSPEVVRRFQREARAASLLSHPNIVTIYDLGQVEDGTLYLAMELCAGMSLKDRAPNVAAGATITDERQSHPAAGPTLGGIPKAILPTPRDSLTARRPAQHASSEAGRKRAPGRRARGHDGARAARRAGAARSASIRPSLTCTAIASSCRGSAAPATMGSATARCQAPTASTASRAPNSASAALRSPPSATAPARLRGPSASGQSRHEPSLVTIGTLSRPAGSVGPSHRPGYG